MKKILNETLSKMVVFVNAEGEFEWKKLPYAEGTEGNLMITIEWEDALAQSSRLTTLFLSTSLRLLFLNFVVKKFVSDFRKTNRHLIWIKSRLVQFIRHFVFGVSECLVLLSSTGCINCVCLKFVALIRVRLSHWALQTGLGCACHCVHQVCIAWCGARHR